jgi:hypothetical protein
MAVAPLKRELGVQFAELDEGVSTAVCFLALMLVRVIKRATGDTWRNVRRELERMHLGEFSRPAGRVVQRTETTPRQREILRALELREPPLLVEHETAPRPRRRTARSG